VPGSITPKPHNDTEFCRSDIRKKDAMPQHDDHDDLAALDFYGTDEAGSEHHSLAEADALDFSGADDQSGAESAEDALDVYAPAESDDTATELAALDQTEATDEEENEEDHVGLFTVTNPSDTVSVSALMDGRTYRVELSAKVTNMGESELADEILVLAGLARQKGLAGQHTFLLESDLLSEGMRDLGLGGNEVVRDFMENGIGLPTPAQAEAAQAEVFATRYTNDHD
jgi:hypothetical protein